MSDPAFPSAGGSPAGGPFGSPLGAPPPMAAPMPAPPPLPPRQVVPVPAGEHLPALPPGFAPPPVPVAPVMPPALGTAPAPFVQPMAAPYPPPPPISAAPPPAFPPPPPPPQTDGPTFHEPRDLELDPNRPGGPGWLLWAAPLVILVMIGGGILVFMATRGGPSTATASVNFNRRTPTFTPTQPSQSPAQQGAKVKVAPRRLGDPNSGSMEYRSRSGNPVALPASPLPPVRDMDRMLKEMWQTGESNGMQFKTIRTLKSQRTASSVVHPVEFSAAATFPKAVQFLQALSEKFPSAVPTSFSAAYPSGEPTNPGQPLPVSATVYWHLADEEADPRRRGPAAPAGAIVQPDVARSLVDVARLADGKVGLVGVSFTTEGAARATETALRPRMIIVGLAESDVQIAEFLQALKVDGHVKDLDLVLADGALVGTQSVRKFTMEFHVPPPEFSTVRRPVSALQMPDPFQPPAWLRAGQKQGDGAPNVAGGAPDDGADAQRAEAMRMVKRLNLQTILARDGKRKMCMINNKLLRTGEQVDGFTIEDISTDAVTVKRGEMRFELKLRK